MIKNQLQRVEDDHKNEMNILMDNNNHLQTLLAEANRNNNAPLANQINDQVSSVALKQQHQLNKFNNERVNLQKSLDDEEEQGERAKRGERILSEAEPTRKSGRRKRGAKRRVMRCSLNTVLVPPYGVFENALCLPLRVFKRLAHSAGFLVFLRSTL